MRFFRFDIIAKVMLGLLVSTLVTITVARAHEVQPSVMDIEFNGDRLSIMLDWVIEAPVAGLDLDGIEDTDDAEGADEYDRLRALSASELNADFTKAWPSLQRKFTIQAGNAQLVPELLEIVTPSIENLEIPRTSTLELSTALPADGSPVVIGWTSDLGPLVVRQRTIEGGYAGYLVSGQLSDPIPREGTVDQSAWEAFVDYISVGFDHIIPKGLDHILFVLGLFFLALQIRPLLWQVTAFTLAHTVTLALGALDIIRISPDIVEPLIAASIVYVAVENLIVRRLHPWRPVIVFCFGLLHGLGFASVLQDFGLGSDHFIPKLIGFNVGVEVGQLSVIAATWLAFGLLFGSHDWYHRRIAAPVSVAIAAIALFWVLERTGTIDPGGAWAPFSLLTEGGLPPLSVTAVACIVAAVLTGLVMTILGSDMLRDVAGFLTSLVMFLGLTATFTSGAWIMAAFLVVAWVLSLRLQSLGGQDAMTTA